jgi:hypothetical protein
MRRMIANTLVLLVSLLASGASGAAPQASGPGRYFAIEVVDEQTGRGVPMVELQTTYGGRHYTDSTGLIAFDEPGLMGRRVFYGVAAHGYEFAKEGFGIRGVVLEPKPGGSCWRPASGPTPRRRVEPGISRIRASKHAGSAHPADRKAPCNRADDAPQGPSDSAAGGGVVVEGDLRPHPGHGTSLIGYLTRSSFMMRPDTFQSWTYRLPS